MVNPSKFAKSMKIEERRGDLIAQEAQTFFKGNREIWNRLLLLPLSNFPFPAFPFPSLSFSLFLSSTFPFSRLYSTFNKMSSTMAQTLPSLPSGNRVSVDHSCSSSTERPKRRTATTFGHSDQEDEEDDYSKPRSKRNCVARANSEALEGGSDQAAEGFTAGGGGTVGGAGGRGSTTKALSEKEKDARRQARMIRNRSKFKKMLNYISNFDSSH